MRRPILSGVAVVAVLAAVGGSTTRAQLAPGGVTSDPFSFYYGYYLPHQQYVATQPRVTDTINQVVATRQYSAQTDRASLYDPISPYGDEENDSFRPSAMRERRAGTQNFSYGGSASSNVTGNGPAMFYNRSARYFPSLRVGRGANRNVAAVRSRGGGGFGGMPTMPQAPQPPGGLR